MSPAFSVSVVIFPRAEKARIATSPALNAVRASVRKRRVVGKASEDEEDGALVPPIDGSCQRKSSWGTQLRWSLEEVGK
jgi:hypothetical protein